jgi:hypothetical protein
MRGLACLVLAGLAIPASAGIVPGDLLVSDQLGRILIVDPTTGEREVLNDEITVNFQGLAQEQDANVLATQGSFARVVEVSAVDGTEEVVSAQQPLEPFTLIFPIDVDLSGAGEIFVLDAGPAPPPLVPAPGAVFQVEDDGTGDGQGPQTLLAKNGDLLDVLQIAVHTNGLFYVTSLNTTLVCEGDGMGTDPIGAIVEVDPDPDPPIDFDDPDADDCANQAILASAADPGLQILLRSPSGVAVDGNGNLVVVSNGDPEVLGDESVVLLDVPTGTLLSTLSTGQLLCLPQQLAIEADGGIVISDVGIGAVIRVDPAGNPATNQTLVSGPTLACNLDPMVPGCGQDPDDPEPFCPIGIAVALVPEPDSALLAAAALATTGLLGARSRRGKGRPLSRRPLRRGRRRG